MVFADDERESNPTTFKFLQAAHAWKKAGAAAPSAVLANLSHSASTARDSNGAKAKDLPANDADDDDDDDDAADRTGSDVASSQGDD